MRAIKGSFLKFLYVMIMGVMISVFSFGASTVQAQEAQNTVTVAEEEVPLSENADDGSGAVSFFGRNADYHYCSGGYGSCVCCIDGSYCR